MVFHTATTSAKLRNGETVYVNGEAPLYFTPYVPDSSPTQIMSTSQPRGQIATVSLTAHYCTKPPSSLIDCRYTLYCLPHHRVPPTASDDAEEGRIIA